MFIWPLKIIADTLLQYSTVIFCFPLQDSMDKIEVFDWLRKQTLECVRQMPWLSGMVVADPTPGRLRLIVNKDYTHTAR